MWKKLVKPNEKIGLKLTTAERELVLESVMCLDGDYEEVLRKTPTGKPVMMTLDEFEDFGGYIAFEANHTADKKLQRKLDAVCQKIERILETHTDEEEPTTLKIGEAERARTTADQAAKLAEWAAMVLVTAELTRIENNPVGRFPSNNGGLAALATLSGIAPELKKKLANQDAELTIAEVASLTKSLGKSFADAEPKQQAALPMLAKSLMDCLQEQTAGLEKSARTRTRHGK